MCADKRPDSLLNESLGWHLGLDGGRSNGSEGTSVIWFEYRQTGRGVAARWYHWVPQPGRGVDKTRSDVAIRATRAWQARSHPTMRVGQGRGASLSRQSSS